MSVNFFTIIVQFLNFLILLFILNKVLYKPLMEAIENRKKTINEKIDNAEKKLFEAEQLKQEILKETENFKRHKEEERNRINNELSGYKSNELEKLKNELEDEKRNFAKKLDDEKEEIISKISKNICSQVGNFVNDILLSLSNQNLKDESFRKFLDEIKNIKEGELNRIRNLKDKDMKFISNFNLTENQKNAVKDTFKNLDINNNICFEINENIVFGNRVIIDSISINSNIENIIIQFTNNLKEII